MSAKKPKPPSSLEVLDQVRQGKLVIGVDMDGTMTDPEAMNETFSDLYAGEVARWLQLPLARLRTWIEEKKAEIIQHPQEYSWVINGYPAAPSVSDYILLNQNAVRLVLLDLLAANEVPGKLQNPADIDDILSQAYAFAHEHTPPRFRPGAREFVEFAQRRGKVVFITNSQTAQVEHRLQALLPGNTVPVMGDAKKMIIDPTYDALPDKVHRPGYSRTIDLRRPHYHSTLTQRVPERFGAEGGLMMGDIPELDLMIPEYLGWWTVLVTSAFTPAWEDTYYDQLKTGFKVPSLYHVVEWLQASA